jgi:hypothetical protein
MQEIEAIIARVSSIADGEPCDTEGPQDWVPNARVHRPVKALLIEAIQVLHTVLTMDWQEEPIRWLLQELVEGVHSPDGSSRTIRIDSPEYRTRAFCPDPASYTQLKEDGDVVAVYDRQKPFAINDEQLADAVRLLVLAQKHCADGIN